MPSPATPRHEALAAVRRQARATPSVLWYVCVTGILATVPGLAVPLLVRVFLDQYLVAGASEWALPVLVGMLLAGVCAAVLSWLQNRVLVRLAVRLSAAGSTRYVWHALRLPSQQVQAFGTGDLTARAAGLQRQAFQGGLLVPMAAVRLLSLVVYCTVLVLMDTWLGLASIAVVAGSIAVGVRMLGARGRLQSAADVERVSLTASTTELVTGIETVKATAAEQWVFDRWSRERAALGAAVSDLSVDGQRLGLLSPLTQAIGLGTVLGLGAWLVVRGDLSLGTLVASQALLVSVLVHAGLLVWAGVLLAGLASTQRQADAVRAVALDPEVAPGAHVRAATPPPVAVRLSVRSVTFGYDPDVDPVLAGLDLDVAPGAWAAVVGGSGSGKSTLARLVVGELQPWSGEIALDGVARLALPRRLRADLVGYVPQYPVLMPGTIRDNVTMFDDTVPLERVEAALRDACVVDAVLARPGGLLEPVGPTGHGFSGGELQRIAIARALVRDPALLVLDEATSALDPLVEVEVVDALRRRGCTCLMVAHRLSTVRDADDILVLEAGTIVQRGGFDVVRRSGRFAELVHG